MRTTALYPKLAVSGIKGNRQAYIPYILACSGVIGMFYIVSFLSQSPLVGQMRGGYVMQTMLLLGMFILAAFSAAFLLYTNSFIIRRRQREFGLYNILGLDKGNIAWIMLWETLIIYVVSEVVGLSCGILFSKLGEMLAVKMLGGENPYTMSVSLPAAGASLIFFGVISVIILIGSLFRVHLSSPVELLSTARRGEKPPKTNVPFTLAGVALLTGAYYMAVTTENPLTAIGVFFLAVLMVIAATYLLFMAGSVAVCRLLQKNKKYYYQTRHFVSVSQMAYRMRRGGAGLASICILSTMVLVTLSTTTCLYAGLENMLSKNYPRDIAVEIYSDDPEHTAVSHSIADSAAAEYGAGQENVLHYDFLRFGTAAKGDVFYISGGNWAAQEKEAMPNVTELYFVSIDDYNRLMGKNEQLTDSEVIVYTPDRKYGHTAVNIYEYGTLKVKYEAETFESVGTSVILGGSGEVYIFANNGVIDKINAVQQGIFGDNASVVHDYYAFDLSCTEETEIAVYERIYKDISDINPKGSKLYNYKISSKANDRGDFISIYGGLFFLGVLLGSVFIFAAVLIMYYKQISEGYEDRQRFAVLQKVGMTRQEIKQSINSQVLTVFFLPLIAAGVHTVFAFPLMSKLLALFGWHDVGLFAMVTGVSFLAFAVLYVTVYLITSRAYFRIVTG